MVGTLKYAFSKRHKGLVGPKEMTVTVSSRVCAQGNMDRGPRPDRKSSFLTTCKDPIKVRVEVETQGCVLFLAFRAFDCFKQAQNYGNCKHYSSVGTLVYILKGKARPFCSSSLMVSSPHRLVSSMKGGEQILSSRVEGVWSAHPSTATHYTHLQSPTLTVSRLYSPVCMCAQ